MRQVQQVRAHLKGLLLGQVREGCLAAGVADDLESQLREAKSPCK